MTYDSATIEIPAATAGRASVGLIADQLARLDLPGAEPGDEVEPLISAAMLTATAFRLRDEEGLIVALRELVDAVDRFEMRRAM
jgi:hypothetical protein